MGSTRRAKKNGRNTRKHEFLPFFKTIYQKGGATVVWTPQGTYSVTAYVGKTTTAPSTYNETNLTNTTDGVGTAAAIWNPLSFDVDSAGNILILQLNNPRLRRVNPTGTVSTLVWNGGTVDGKYSAINDFYYNSNTGYGPPPLNSRLASYSRANMYRPQGIALNKANDVFYFTEAAHHAVRTAVSDTGPTFSGKTTHGLLQNLQNGATTASMGLNTIVWNPNNGQRKDGDLNTCGFRIPSETAVDPRGTRLYVAEENNYIRMIDIVSPTNYYVSTLFLADASVQNMEVDNSGNLFFTMQGKHSIWKIIPPAAGTRSPSANTTTTLLAKGANASLFAGNDGSADYTDATGNAARFNDPRGLAVDRNNNLYVADRGNSVIRVITSAGVVTTFAGVPGGTNLDSYPNGGDGPNTLCYFSNPFDVAVAYRQGTAGSDAVYVLDGGHGWNSASSTFSPANIGGSALAYCRIRKISYIPPPSAPTGVTLVAADSTTATFSWAVGSGLTGYEPTYASMFYFLVKESPTSTEVRIDLPANTGNPPVFGNMYIIGNRNPDNGQQGFYMNNYISVQLRPNTTYSSIKLVSYNNSGSSPSDPLTVKTLPQATNYTSLFCGIVGTPGYVNGGGPFSKFSTNIRGMAVDLSGNLYVADAGNNCIRVVNRIGTSRLFFGTPPTAASGTTGLNGAADITFTATGAFPLYVADNANNRIVTLDSDGNARQLSTTGVTIDAPTGITMDPNGNLYVVSQSKHCIYKITSAGVVSVYAGTNGTSGFANGAGATASFNGPTGITYDSYAKCLYVSDTNNHLIRKIWLDAAGTVGTLAGNMGMNGMQNGLGSVARFNTPRDLTTDLSGNLYVCDMANHCIRKLTVAGFVTTYSGTASTSGSTDGTSIPTAYNAITTTVKYNNPIGICKGAAGNFYIADNGNNCVRVLSSTAPPTPPTSIYLSDITTTTASIAWSGDTGGTFYSYVINPTSDFTGMPTQTSSPAMFENLSDGSAYTMSLIVASPSGVAFSSSVPCITPVDPSKFVVTVPYSECLQLIGSTLAAATMEWTGVSGASSLVCSINPADQAGNTSLTLPPKTTSPYIIKGLSAATSYTITLTANYTAIPGVGQGAAAAPFTITSTPVTFTTVAARTVSVKTLAGRVGSIESSTLLEMDPVNASPGAKPPAGVTQYKPSNAYLLRATMSMARDIVMDGNGSLYVACGACIVKIDPPTDNLYVMHGEVPVPLLPTPHALGAADPNLAAGSPIPPDSAGSKISLYAGNPIAAGAIAASGTWPGTASSGTNIRIYNCTALGYDKVNKILYVSDTLLHIVLKIWTDSAGNVQATHFAGKVGNGADVDGALSNTAQFIAPTGLAVGPDGSVFVCTSGGNIRKIKDGQVTTISGSGVIGASGISGNSAHGIAVLADGSVYVAATAEHCIYKFTPTDAKQTAYTQSIFAGTKGGSGYQDGPIANARFSAPQAMYSDSGGDLYVYDSINPRVRLISGGKVYTILGTGASGNTNGDTSVATIPGFASIGDITVSHVVYSGMAGDINGNIYFTNSNALNNSSGSGYVVRALIPAPPPTYPKSVYDTYINRQQASSALMYSASSARIQGASSAKAQTASSAVAQTASSAVAQQASQAQASSAIVQNASSAVAQTASSAVAQRASTAQASSAVAQTASSAVAQTASSAVAQTASQAQASSAVAQTASQAQASSAVAQTASQANWQTLVDVPIREISTLKPQKGPIQATLTDLAKPLYSSGIGPTDIVDQINTNLARLATLQENIAKAGAVLIPLQPEYQDPDLQTVIPDPALPTGYTKVFDLVRNSMITLDSRKKIVDSITPASRTR